MNKQLEEMAKDIEFCDRNLVANCHNVKCKECRYFYSKEDCYMLRLSEMLIAKGYRKASTVAREIFEEIERLLDTYSASHHSIGEVCGESYFERGLEEAIAEIKKKYESEVADDE
jgi:hypothetical protein